jgi:NADPH-dependent glutamate synthase beta subunit-like oxidoreductase/NAD(P)H-flavin reductase
MSIINTKPTGRMNETDFALGIKNFRYSDLYKPPRLRDLANAFYAEVKMADAALHARLIEYINSRGENLAGTRAESELLIAAAPHLSNFIARLFNIERERAAQIAAVKAQDAIWDFRQFITRRATKKFTPEQALKIDAERATALLTILRADGFAETLSVDAELAVARIAVQLLEWERILQPGAAQKANAKVSVEDIARAMSEVETLRAKLSSEIAQAIGNFIAQLEASTEVQIGDDENFAFVNRLLRLLEAWATAHFTQDAARARVLTWVSFRVPHPLDYSHLVPLERPDKNLPELMRGLDKNLRRRDGFDLTDPRGAAREVLYEVNYCLYCHERDKDSCSHGFHEKDGTTKRNPLGYLLGGCPLDEKISEMHWLKKRGDSIAALALVVIDNPMCPGTGHRICNDCMKACIFQKQDPVNIPQAETGVLTDVLNMPYGFEIYSLLTRWNPLNAKRPFALPYNGKNVLVVGLGPAGYTLAHYLLNEGFGVVGVDGLKIEPLKDELVGDDETPPRAIENIHEIESPLDERVLSGFGGVSEYGITVRWDKNFLTMIHLTLARRANFKFYGGVRFGGTLTIEDAWHLGFDHIAIATGAGKPTIVKMKNNLIRGIRQASDFLMALQLTGAFKRDSLANLQVRLPAIVIGGGLTGIDTATELAAYYPVQVEKMLERHELLAREFGESEIWSRFNEEERAIYEEFLSHGREIRRERERARSANEEPDFISLVRKWGGVSLVYRKRLQDSPAYRLNHEEVLKALEEGIQIVENMTPVEAVPDEYGAVKALIFERSVYDEATGKHRVTGETVELPARTVCVAAGTAPNTTYEKEQPGTAKLDAWQQFFAPHKVERNGDGRFHLVPSESTKTKRERAFFTSYEKDGRFISYYGDNHPAYAGNVVKAMASAKHGYEHVVELFEDEIKNLRAEDQPERERKFRELVRQLDENIIARVVRVERLTPTIVEIIVHAPMQARKFKPGQFYRLQNFEIDAPEFDGTKLLMEGLALTGAWTNPQEGLLSLIVLEMGASSRMCATLKPGQEVIVMGPTGTPTEIPENQTVLLAGGGLGNAVLFSIAKALKEKNNRVIYFAGYKNGADLFKREEIEASTDQVIWSTDMGAEIIPHRPQDAHYRGNIVQAMLAYAKGELNVPQLINLKDVDRIIAIGSDRMMNGVRVARHTVLKPYLKAGHLGIGSINSPMQCMMKEICAQCLQRHVDPETGEESFVFSCFNQDQILDRVDFNNLNERLRANAVQEKLSNLWLDKIFKEAAAVS